MRKPRTVAPGGSPGKNWLAMYPGHSRASFSEMPRVAGEDSWMARSRQPGKRRSSTSASARSRGIEPHPKQSRKSRYQGWVARNRRSALQIGQKPARS